MKKVIILGSTGSIGENTLDVIRKQDDSFKVIGLSCYKKISKMNLQIEEFKPDAVSVTHPEAVHKITSQFSGKIFKGESGLLNMIEELDADIVVNGISGAKGLLPTLKALQSGKDCALANKETIVMAGPLVLSEAHKRGKSIIPVDSEHSGLFQLINQVGNERLSEIIITASGGAFRDIPPDKLDTVTVEDALKHPTWNMGKKITIDSATLGNKGLEVIEAHYLFSMPLTKIKVVIHPQSLVHSLVKTIDGCLFAQMSKPDMRMPIHYALFYPEIAPSDFGSIDLAGKEFTFSEVDKKKYRMLSLAYRAAEQGGGYPVIFNASNEIAVTAFISGKISFTTIPRIVEQTLDRRWEKIVPSIEEILDFDKRAREAAKDELKKCKHSHL